MWDQDKYLKAWKFALKYHNGQKLPGTEFPYVSHISCVAMEVMCALSCETLVEKKDLCVSCALLHDTIEDTDADFDLIKSEFGNDIAQGVLALTKNKDLPTKKEQINDSLKRIMEQPREIWMVKLADRITNLNRPPSYWGKEKIIYYKEEACKILEELGSSSSFLGSRLDEKIKNYDKYI